MEGEFSNLTILWSEKIHCGQLSSSEAESYFFFSKNFHGSDCSSPLSETNTEPFQVPLE